MRLQPLRRTPVERYEFRVTWSRKSWLDRRSRYFQRRSTALRFVARLQHPRAQDLPLEFVRVDCRRVEDWQPVWQADGNDLEAVS